MLSRSFGVKSLKYMEVAMKDNAAPFGVGKASIDPERCVHCHICRKNCSFLEKYQIDIGDKEQLKELAYHCFLCGNCSEACPMGIDGRGVILAMRQEKAENNHGKCKEKGYTFLLAEKQNYIFRNKRHLKGKSILFLGCNFPSFYPKKRGCGQ